MKKFLSGILVGALLMTSTYAFAETKKTIEAVFGQVKLVVNGKSVDKETLLYDGTTYVPLRAAAEVLGMEVGWDGNTNTASLTSPTASTPAPTQKPAENSYSRTNPAPINTLQTIVVKDYSNDYTADVRVTEVIRGDKAWNMIKEANMFNSEPDDGYEYILVKIAISALSVAGDKSLNISTYDFKCFSSNNVAYDNKSIVEPEPKLAGKIYTGGSTEGYIAFQIKKDDAAPKIVYGQKYDGSGGIWFSLK